MRATVSSFRHTFAVALIGLLFAVGFPSGNALANASSDDPLITPTLASTMAQEPTAFVSSDVVLDDGAEPVVGSFTVDGMTFALVGDGAMLVSVSQQVTASQDVPGSGVGSELAPGEGDEAMAVIPSTVAYDGVEYPVTAIGPYAFYLSGATEVALPASIASVDDRAFRSSDVAWVDVDPANPDYASYDGCLYDSQLNSLLLIPEGRAGSVSIPCEAEVITPGVFSHCSLVDAISVDGDGAAFASWDGLLYDATGTTLLRVPAGATDITIREGCTTIAAGAMEGCAKLESIDAPSTVVSISPDVFSQEASVFALPAASLDEEAARPDESDGVDAVEVVDERGAASRQLASMVALKSADDALPKVNPATIEASLSLGADSVVWEQRGFVVVEAPGTDSSLPQDEVANDASSDNLPSHALGQDADVELGEVSALDQEALSQMSDSEVLAQMNAGSGDAGELDDDFVNIVEGTDFTTSDGVPMLSRTVAFLQSGSVYSASYTMNGGEVDLRYKDSSVFSEVNNWRFMFGLLYNTTVREETFYGANGSSAAVLSIQFGTYVPYKAGSVRPEGGTVSQSYAIADVKRYFKNKTGSELGNVWFIDGDSTMSTALIKAAEKGDGWLFRCLQSDIPNRSSTKLTNAYASANTCRPESGDDGWLSGYLDARYGLFPSGNPFLNIYGYTGQKWNTTTGLGVGSAAATPTRKGYTFSHWYDGANRTITANSLVGGTGTNNHFYAEWTANKYTVSFNANGGSGGQSANVTATYDSAMPSISTTKPTRAGYTFGGWYDTSASSGGTQYYTAACASARTWNKDSAATLYARWTASTITCTWNSQGGSAIGNTSATYSGSAKVPMPSSNPTKAGYTFAGWYTAASGGSQVTSSTALPTSNPTYHAHWTANTITCTWNSQGGSSVASTSATYSASAKVPMPSSNPTRAGYTFAGWFTAASGGTQVTSSTALPTSNPTYHAHWTANTITLTWNSNGGSSVSPTTQTYSTTAKVSLPSAPTRTGYTFAGWWTAASGGAQVTSSTSLPASSTTYYAHWSSSSYTVTLTWNSNGGSSVASTSATYSASAKVPMPSSNPTRVGYTFKGWFTSTTSTTQVTSSTALPASNTTYYAQWTANTITLTWNTHGGTTVSNTSATYSSSTKVPMPAATTRTGWTFAGWWTAETGGTQVTSSTALPTSNQTYHARWSKNSYTIYCDYAGGSATNPTTYDVETATFTLKNPTRTGYRFTGWSGTGLSGASNTTVTIAQGSTGDRTFVAHWSAKTYTVSFDANGGSGGQADDVTATYDAAMPAILTAQPTKAGCVFGGWYDTPANEGGTQYYTSACASARTWDKDASATLHARWVMGNITCTWDPHNGDAAASTSAIYSDDATVPVPVVDPTRGPGWSFLGWWTEPDGGERVTAETPLPAEDTTYHAHWTPMVSADVPLEVTAKVDLLGIEEPIEATGWIESRSGGALQVAEVGFAPLQGAADLFGSRTADVFLEALAEGSASADVSFALDAAASESDASKLAPFALPDGYGTRIGVGYRFAIPDDVLAAIDPDRFTEVTTPVGQVVYTVALAG